jgi:hypothetical protein
MLEQLHHHGLDIFFQPKSTNQPHINIRCNERRTRWVKHVACMEGMRNTYRVLVGKSEKRRQLGKYRHDWRITL